MTEIVETGYGGTTVQIRTFRPMAGKAELGGEWSPFRRTRSLHQAGFLVGGVRRDSWDFGWRTGPGATSEPCAA